MRIRNLVVIAGPSGVGKSFLIERFRKGLLPEITRHLGIDDPDSWSCVSACELDKFGETDINCLILHYDLTRPWKRGLKSGFIDDKSLSVLRDSDKITVVTLWATPGVVRKRFLQRQKEHGIRGTIACLLRAVYRLIFKKGKKDVTQLFDNPFVFFSLYDQWFKFCESARSAVHCVLNTVEDCPSLMRMSGYPAVRSKLCRELAA